MENENKKFDEVVSDIIQLMSKLSYEDVEKEKLRVQLLINFNLMCEDYPSYLHNMSVLSEEENSQMVDNTKT